MRHHRIDHDVLVVGAGPAGLTAAITLARHGIDVLVVERHAGTSPFPKATGVTTRTMELIRTWGLAEQVRAGAMRVRPCVSVTETLTGPELATESFDYPTDEQALAVSPVTPVYCPQDHLEPILLAHLIERGGRIRFGTELTDLQIRDTGAVAQLRDRDSGRRCRVGAGYVIGADGPRSSVRAAIGAGFEYLGRLGDYVAITFRAELTRRLPRPPAAINAVQVPGAAGLFVPTSTDDRWIYARDRPVDGDGPVTGFTPQCCTELLRAGTGLPDLAPQILSVQPFKMAGQVATTLRRGPVFLVGDAAHRTTPMGGTGMNTAIHGAHNLGWKLAWVLNGWAAPALLDSYQDERLPVGTANVARSLRTGPHPEPQPDGLTRDIGGRYHSAVLDPGSDTGRRAPHAWIRHCGSRVSTIDLFDGRLTVLTGPGGDRWRRAVAELAATGLPVRALSVERELHAVDGAFAAGYRLGAAGAALVRPDGILAWRHPGTHGATRSAAGPEIEARVQLGAAVERALGWPSGPIRARRVPPAAGTRSARPPHPSRPAPQRCRPAA
jgi:putative polyketide hydroxylase